VATEDDAERVTDGVGEDPEACLAFTRDTGGTQAEQFLLGLVGITHANIEVQLLGIRRVRPARRRHALPLIGIRACRVLYPGNAVDLGQIA
jgi:hypothetical protein